MWYRENSWWLDAVTYYLLWIGGMLVIFWPDTVIDLVRACVLGFIMSTLSLLISWRLH